MSVRIYIYWGNPRAGETTESICCTHPATASGKSVDNQDDDLSICTHTAPHYVHKCVHTTHKHIPGCTGT